MVILRLQPPLVVMTQPKMAPGVGAAVGAAVLFCVGTAVGSVALIMPSTQSLRT